MNHPVKPLVLLIIDGFGYSPESQSNAIALAKTPCWDKLQKKYPMTYLNCSGHVVGLPEGQMGNSEVGHLHIGSGRYVPQEFSKVNDAIVDGLFLKIRFYVKQLIARKNRIMRFISLVCCPLVVCIATSSK